MAVSRTLPGLARESSAKLRPFFGVLLVALAILVGTTVWFVSPSTVASLARTSTKPVLCVQGSKSREGIGSSIMSYVYGIALADYYGRELRAAAKPSKHGYDSVSELGFKHCKHRSGGPCDITEWAQSVQTSIMAAYVNRSRVPVSLPFGPGGSAKPGSAASRCKTLYFTRQVEVDYVYKFKRFMPRLLGKAPCQPYEARARRWVIIHEREGDLLPAHELGFRDRKSMGRPVSKAIIRRLVSCCKRPEVIFVNEHMEPTNAQTIAYHFRVVNNTSPMATLREIPCSTAIFSGSGGFSRLIAAAGDVRYHFAPYPLSARDLDGWQVESSLNIMSGFFNASCEAVAEAVNCEPRKPGTPSPAGELHDIMYAAESASASVGGIPATI